MTARERIVLASLGAILGAICMLAGILSTPDWTCDIHATGNVTTVTCR